MTGLLLVGVVCVLVGVSVGATGYGGFLIPVAGVAALGLSPTGSVYHALLGSLLPTILAAALYLRSPAHRPRWGLIGWLSVGTVPGVGLGRWVTTRVDAPTLTVALGVVVVAAGVLVLGQACRGAGRTGTSGGADTALDGGPARRSRSATALACVAAGALGGLATVLAGVGGPLVTVPVMVVAGVPMTAAVGSALVNALVGTALTLTTMVGQLPLDLPLLAVVTATMAAGMVAGVRLHHRLPTGWLLVPVGVVSVVTGAWLAVGAL